MPPCAVILRSEATKDLKILCCAQNDRGADSLRARRADSPLRARGPREYPSKGGKSNETRVEKEPGSGAGTDHGAEPDAADGVRRRSDRQGAGDGRNGGGKKFGPGYPGGVLNASGEDDDLLIGVEPPHVHAWSEWTLTAAASCTEAGSRTRSCACGASESEAVEALGHEWGAWTDETAASCTEPGSHKHACTREGCGFSETVAIDALGHDWGEATEVVAATCTEAGSYHHACQRENCGFEETVTVEALGHDWGEWTVLKEATKTETGEREHTCQREGCGVTVSEEIPVLPPDEFTVRFMNGETEVASVSVAENTAIGDKLPAGPDKGAAYVFEGWFDNENNAVDAETVITGPLTASARYRYLPEGSGTAVRVSLSRKLSPLVSVQDAGPAWERSYNSILTGLADCLPLSAFSGIYQ